jgi:ATP synthase protein I
MASGRQGRHAAWALLSVGTTLVASLGIGALAGHWLDGKLGTEPWCLAAGVLLGSVAGLLDLYRTATRNLK